MCGPEVMQTVKERIERDGAPKINRRNLLKLGGAAAAGAAAAAIVPAYSVQRVAVRGGGAVIDLSHPLTTATPTFPSFNPPLRGTVYTVEENGFYAQVWSFAEHSGTHMDAPGHFIADGQRVDAIEPAKLVGRTVVIDISERAADDADAQLTPDDLTAWEAANGEIPAGAVVCMYSGWEARFTDPAAFLNFGDDGAMHFPGFHPEAAQWLVEERDIVGVGVDTLSLDYGLSATFDAHVTFLGAGLWGLENLANLSVLIGNPYHLVAGVPRYQEGSGGPARVLALLDGLTG